MPVAFSAAVRALLADHDTHAAANQGLVALNTTGKHIYAGTVPPAEVARRRAANKTARASRRRNRTRR